MVLRKSKRDGAAVEPPPPPRIVVLADDPGPLELLARVLGAAPDGWDVGAARDQRELIELLVAAPAAAAVVDVRTGGLGGAIKVLDSIRNASNPAIASVPVVLIVSSSKGALFSWQAGTDELLVRPFHARDLVDAVARVLARPEDERPKHRRRQLNAARTGGVRA